MNNFFLFIIFIAVGIISGVIFNKFVIKNFSINKRIIFNVLTMLIFICSSISLFIIVSLRSYVVTTIDSYYYEVEQYIFNNYSDNEIIINGIDITIITENSQIQNTVSDLIASVFSELEINGNNLFYSLIIDSVIKNLLNEIDSIIDEYLNIYIYPFADNNIISITSILNYFINIIKIQINIIFNKLIFYSLVPFFIYVTSIAIYIIVSKITGSKTVMVKNESIESIEGNIVMEKNVPQYNWMAVLLFCVFLGSIGIHRFYVGKIGTGILMILTFGGFGIWWIIDIIMIITGQFTDNTGQKISNKDYM